MKANSNQSVLRTLAKLGAGADVVSGGELKRALAAGIPPAKILFFRIGKSETELRAALSGTFSAINVESSPNLNCFAVGPRDRPDRANLGSGQSRRRFRLARKNLDRASPEQIRRTAGRARCGLRPRRKTAGIKVTGRSICISAARSPIWCR